jgi:hypothetical protein
MVVTKFIKIEKLLLIIWVLLFRMDKIPWYYGRTVGANYGQNKRLIQAVAKRKEDPRWLVFIRYALNGRIPPSKKLYIEPFTGTEEQKQNLLHLIEEAERSLMTLKL